MRNAHLTVLVLALCACGHASNDIYGATPARLEPQLPPSAASSSPAGVKPQPPSSAAGSAPAAAGPSRAAAPSPASAAPAPYTVAAFALPGALGPVTLDYIAYDRDRDRVWVPVGETGSVDVFDIGTSSVTRVDGFKTEKRELHGKMRQLGPSAVSIGDGVAYIGDRATGQVCPVPEATLKIGECLRLPTPTDGVLYVREVKEIWVTTPKDRSLTVLDATTPAAIKPKLIIKTEGEPEGYAVDAARGLFYTNLKDKNLTIAIDIKTHKLVAAWSSQCGEDGPRGVAVDPRRNLVFVACTDGVRVLDAGHAGAALGRLDTGAGVDNLDYDATTRLLYVAASKAARLTVARVDDKGQAAVVAVATTAEGARNAVVDSDGNVYVADPRGARLLVFRARPTHDRDADY